MKFIKKYFNRKFFKKNAPNAFSKTYQSIEKSKSFLKLCNIIHNRNLSILNTMSSYQLDLLEDRVGSMSAKNLLDIGCGNGELTTHLADKYSLQSVGIDFALEKKSSKRNQFLKQDHEDFKLDRKFDLILSIDSFYMINNIKNFMANLLLHLNDDGKVIIFMTLVDNEFQSSNLAKALNKLPIIFTIKDLTDDDLAFWNTSKATLEEMNQEFVDEDQFKLWNIKNKEALNNLELHKRNRIQRIFLEITKT